MTVSSGLGTLRASMTRSIDLYELQETDSAIDGAERRLAEIAGELENEGGLAEFEEQARELEAESDQAQREQREAAAAVEDQREKVRLMEEKLYGGTVKIPRELKALETDVTALKRHLATLEEQTLAVMTRVEQAEAALHEGRQTRDQQAEERRRMVDSLENERTEIEGKIDALRSERSRRAERIDRPDLALYERLRRARAGRAVAKVEQGICLGCRITLPATIFQRARSGLKLVQCTSCERILYVA